MSRRSGYGGGGGCNRPGFGGPVSPWQGGNVPGGNQYNSGNLLSQLSEPQAQLAIAITKLLQPQQQVPPSLLSMNTAPPMHGGGGYGSGRNFSQRGNMNRRSQHNMKSFNNKNKMNNRDEGFNNRRRSRSNSKNKNTKPQRNASSSKLNIKPSSTKTVSPKPSGNEVNISDKDVNAETAADTTETPVKESDDKSEGVEFGDKKRDWKEEKSTLDQDAENAEEDKEKKESEASDQKSSTDDIKGTNKYDGIPKELFHCYICQKKMWDAESYDKHMHGRAHQQMFEKVEESYRIKADMMREAIRLAEEKNNIEMDRMKRLGKKTKAQQLSRCVMCDLDFYGQLFLHRKSPSHHKLKQFLHPRCSPCNKEFPNRMEWENHRHSAEHLKKKAASILKGDKNEDQNDDGVLLEDESFIVIDSTENDEVDDPNAVIDLTNDDLPESCIKIPTYKPSRAVGLSLIEPVSGFFCKSCSKFFLTEKASQQHAMTKGHYDIFVNILNEKLAENEEKKRKANDLDDEGNWKRRKTTADDEKQEEKANSDKNAVYDSAEPMETDINKKEDQSIPFITNECLINNSLMTDPNDVSLNVSENSSLITDAIWKEVDNKIDEILEENPLMESAKSSPKVKIPSRPQRATRGRKQ